jgi:hypothetical protein
VSVKAMVRPGDASGERAGGAAEPAHNGEGGGADRAGGDAVEQRAVVTAALPRGVEGIELRGGEAQRRLAGPGVAEAPGPKRDPA